MNTTPHCWNSEPAGLRPSPAQVDIWRLCLSDVSTGGDVSTEDTSINLNAFATVLSADEHARANRFKIAAKRREFIIGRGLTRSVLGRLLRKDPAELPFGYGPHGKPFLVQPSGPNAVELNLSHSHHWLLLAVTLGRAIGIDIEKQRPEVNIEQLAQRFFSAAEAEALSQLAPGLRRAAFFRCWSRKEAVIKAVGRGVSLGLDKFDVSLAPDQSAALLEVRFDPDMPAEWRLINLDVAPDYSATLAIEAADSRLATPQLRHWDCQLDLQ